jgi:hypothetical protein
MSDSVLAGDVSADDELHHQYPQTQKMVNFRCVTYAAQSRHHEPPTAYSS